MIKDISLKSASDKRFSRMGGGKKLGFTMVEIIVAIAIIAVVAGMTLPIFMSRANEKSLSVLAEKMTKQVTNQVAGLMLAEGVKSFDETSMVKTVNDNDFSKTAEPFLKKYFRLTKYCSDPKRCFAKNYKRGNATVKAEDFLKGACGRMRNGASICITPKYIIKDENGETTTTDIHVIVDLNGFKKPNKYGEDLITFDVKTEGKIQAISEADEKAEYEIELSCGNGEYGIMCCKEDIFWTNDSTKDIAKALCCQFDAYKGREICGNSQEEEEEKEEPEPEPEPNPGPNSEGCDLDNPTKACCGIYLDENDPNYVTDEEYEAMSKEDQDKVGNLWDLCSCYHPIFDPSRSKSMYSKEECCLMAPNISDRSFDVYYSIASRNEVYGACCTSQAFADYTWTSENTTGSACGWKQSKREQLSLYCEVDDSGYSISIEAPSKINSKNDFDFEGAQISWQVSSSGGAKVYYVVTAGKYYWISDGWRATSGTFSGAFNIHQYLNNIIDEERLTHSHVQSVAIPGIPCGEVLWMSHIGGGCWESAGYYEDAWNRLGSAMAYLVGPSDSNGNYQNIFYKDIDFTINGNFMSKYNGSFGVTSTSSNNCHMIRPANSDPWVINFVPEGCNGTQIINKSCGRQSRIKFKNITYTNTRADGETYIYESPEELIFGFFVKDDELKRNK